MDSNESGPTNSSSSPLRASMLDGARDLQIVGANFTSVAGNSIRDSNVFVFVKQESGISFRSMLILVLLLFLFFCLL